MVSRVWQWRRNDDGDEAPVGGIEDFIQDAVDHLGGAGTGAEVDASPSPPTAADATVVTPRVMPEVTRAAHSSSSGVLIRRTAWRSEGGMGASGSAFMKSFTSVVSLETISDTANAADVYPSVAVYICRARSDWDTRCTTEKKGEGEEVRGVRTESVETSAERILRSEERARRRRREGRRTVVSSPGA